MSKDKDTVVSRGESEKMVGEGRRGSSVMSEGPWAEVGGQPCLSLPESPSPVAVHWPRRATALRTAKTARNNDGEMGRAT